MDFSNTQKIPAAILNETARRVEAILGDGENDYHIAPNLVETVSIYVDHVSEGESDEPEIEIIEPEIVLDGESFSQDEIATAVHHAVWSCPRRAPETPLNLDLQWEELLKA